MAGSVATVRLRNGSELVIELSPERLRRLMAGGVGRVGVRDASNGRWMWLALRDVVAVADVAAPAA